MKTNLKLVPLTPVERRLAELERTNQHITSLLALITLVNVLLLIVIGRVYL